MTTCEHCLTNASSAIFSSSKCSERGCVHTSVSKHVDMWPGRSGGRLPAVTPWISVCMRAPVLLSLCMCVCVRSLCMLVRVWQHFLTYILLSTINCKEICVNQLPLWPACLLPLAGWLSRSADLIKTKETISSDFHFCELKIWAFHFNSANSVSIRGVVQSWHTPPWFTRQLRGVELSGQSQALTTFTKDTGVCFLFHNQTSPVFSQS